jgi:biopolymer transport protein ExbD
MASTQPLNLLAKRPRRAFRGIITPDMTPMVGIGFLLVSFFLLTTTLVKPAVMQVTMPVRQDRTNEEVCYGLRPSDIMNVVLGKNSQVYYYSGVLDEAAYTNFYKTNFSASGLRKVLLHLSPRTIVLIKPSDEAKYQDMVDALDEMNITDRKKYAVVDISASDYELLKSSSH